MIIVKQRLLLLVRSQDLFSPIAAAFSLFPFMLSHADSSSFACTSRRIQCDGFLKVSHEYFLTVAFFASLLKMDAAEFRYLNEVLMGVLFCEDSRGLMCAC